MQRVISFFLWLLLFAPALASAQESGSMSGSTLPAADSGAILRERIDALLQDAPSISPLSRTTLLLPAKNIAAFQAETDRFRERRNALRNDCRETLRRANRDTWLRQALLCYRSDLLLEMNWLRKDRQQWATLPLLSETKRVQVLEHSDALIDAILAIIDGIDSGLFTQRELLEEAKHNLFSTYRSPYLNAVTHARADRLIVWISLFARRMEEALRLQPDSPEPLPYLLEAAECLLRAKEKAQVVFNEENWQMADEYLHESYAQLKQCSDAMRTVIRIERKRLTIQEAPKASGTDSAGES